MPLWGSGTEVGTDALRCPQGPKNRPGVAQGGGTKSRTRKVGALGGGARPGRRRRRWRRQRSRGWECWRRRCR